MEFKGLRDVRLWLILLFLAVLAVRLIIVFQVQNFNYDAYFALRQVDHIRQTGLPLYNDPFSYGGKTQLFAPLQYYILAFSSLFMPSALVGKVVPNIFAALLVFMVYAISLRLTKNPRISFTTAFMSGFIPILFLDINNISVDYLSLLLILGIVYCMFRLSEKKYVDYALILIFLLVLTTPLAFLLILGLFFYLLLAKLENVQTEMKELEIILFFTFLVFWINLLIYKNAFLNHGLLVIWQNMPVQILNNTFARLTFLESFYTISIVPLILGIYSAYIMFYKEKNKNILLLTAFLISSFLLLWLRLINLVTGLVFLSMALVVMTAPALKRISEFIEKTKFYKREKLLFVIFIIIFLVTAVAPSVYIGLEKGRVTPTNEDIEALKWAAVHIPENVTIVSTLQEGNLIAYYGKRKNVMDYNFLLTSNIDQRLNDLDNIYTTKFETEAVSNLNKYNARYILITSNAMEAYGISQPSYINDRTCFDEIYYLDNTSLYKSLCRIRSG